MLTRRSFWAPTVSTWGVENRTCALRVIPGSAKSTRVEYRVGAADANPYLALAAAVASGLWGIEHKVDAGEPVPYIERTRQYYRALGYANDYVWAHHDDVPFARLPKPLAECRLALITTANPAGYSGKRQAWSGEIDPAPAALHTADLAWDKESTHTDDRGSFLPIEVATELAKRRTERLGPDSIVGALLGLTLAIGAGAAIMATAHSFALAVAAYLAVSLLRPVYYPLVDGWMVTRIAPSVRATALSAKDMFDSGGQIVAGPVIGAIGTLASIRIALFGTTLWVLSSLKRRTFRERKRSSGRPSTSSRMIRRLISIWQRRLIPI